VNVEPGVLAEALQREPVRRPAQRGVPTGPGPAATTNGGPSGLELEALGLLLRYPALATEAAGNGTLPFRDATAAALVRAWQERVAMTDGTPGAADLEGFLAALDPASADMARDLLARLAEGGQDSTLDLDTARGVLRVTLLRLREARLEEDLRDGRLLLEEAQRDGDRERLATIEQQIIQLGREKAEVTKAIREPADLAGSRRS
ncbi:MAG TPA: hypothetical protein VFY43_00710, partial [Candidatus Limnocylindria bacterium]|nr:hypothetical protein [Candidatus Limnocylindria bacterium]